jgi:SAM-dependent methyltransferase
MDQPPAPIHPAAAAGYRVAADDYVRGRPGYPPEIVRWLRDALGLGPGATAVDLGAGTGKFTSYLLATGSRVIAVEPVDEMRGKLSAALPQVEALAGTAESLPLTDGSADAVVCAQSFHWFATPRALAEIRRVLKPGGWLGLVWNRRDPHVGWAARLDQIVHRVDRDSPSYRTGEWRKLFPAPGFGPLQERRFPHNHTGPPEDVILGGRVRSTSFVATRQPEEPARIEDEVRALIASEPDLAGKDTVTVPHETFAFWTEKAS